MKPTTPVLRSLHAPIEVGCSEQGLSLINAAPRN